jgi:two-component system, cell cycle sensor histidine kinase and response regulator CckA
MNGDIIHVLLVEDNPGDARVVKEILEHDESTAFRVKHVSTLEEAMSSLSPDSANQVILLDLGLPDERGLRTLQRIIPVAQEAGIVVITGLQDEELGIAAIREGAHDYLIKGQVDGDQLRRILRYAVERHKLQSDLKAEIDRRARVQQALELSEERYRLLLETAPMGIVITNERGRVVQVNAEALRIFGYMRRELIGQTIDLLLPGRRSHEDEEQLSGYLKEPHMRPVGLGLELFARRKDGTEFPAEISLGPLATEEGTLISATVVDITARKKMEEQLRIAQRMESVGCLAAGVAHDFNNGLGIILGNLELLVERVPSDEISRKYLDRVRMAVEGATGVTRQLLAFSRKQILQPVIMDLNTAIEQLNKMTQRLIGENIRVVLSLGPGLCCVKADPGQIEQVLINLVVNARDAMPNGGELFISTTTVLLDEEFVKQHLGSKPGDFVNLSVRDTGCGMDKTTLAHIFEPFFTTKGIGKGTGLGLATVYGIVKQSEGYTWVETELGVGTTFEIYLPRVENTITEERPQKPAGFAGGTETILLVEDEPGFREVTRIQLEKLGYRVLEASDAEQALALFDEHAGEISLLLTDVIMTGENGRALADRLRVKKQGLQVLCMSGYTDDEVLRQASSDGSPAILVKPFSLEKLALRVREALDGGQTPSGK